MFCSFHFRPHVLTSCVSIRCIEVIAGVLGRAGEEGQKKRLEAAKTGRVTWSPPDGLGAPYDEAEEPNVGAARSGRPGQSKQRTAPVEEPQLDDGFY
jgi:small subunit ribosomal protein S2